jgi:hypothetical protein
MTKQELNNIIKSDAAFKEKWKFNKYPNVPFVSFKHNNGDKIEIVRTHVKEVYEDTKWVHALNGQSYLKTNIVGPIELVFYCGYDLRPKRKTNSNSFNRRPEKRCNAFLTGTRCKNKGYYWSEEDKCYYCKSCSNKMTWRQGRFWGTCKF